MIKSLAPRMPSTQGSTGAQGSPNLSGMLVLTTAGMVTQLGWIRVCPSPSAFPRKLASGSILHFIPGAHPLDIGDILQKL